MVSLPRPGYGLLRCPVCRLELTAAAGALVCRNRHGFDLAREGYVNLLSSRRRRPAGGGDSAVQLRHRAAFLDAGYFDAIAGTIAEYVQQANANPTFGRWCILDAGSGTGHHLARIAEALPPPVIGIGLDISKDAARLAARRWPILAFAVANLWTEWPVQDAAVDLVISIFAPKNFPEAARVLRPGGWLAWCIPARIIWPSLATASGCCGSTNMLPDDIAKRQGASSARLRSTGSSATPFSTLRLFAARYSWVQMLGTPLRRRLMPNRGHSR